MKTIECSERPENQIQGKIIIKGRQREKKNKISNEKRIKLLELVSKNLSLLLSARILGINHSSAKNIYYKYKRTGRVQSILRKNGQNKISHESDKQ